MFSRKTTAYFFGDLEEIISRSDGSKLLTQTKKQRLTKVKHCFFMSLVYEKAALTSACARKKPREIAGDYL